MGIGDYVNWATEAVTQKLPPFSYSSVKHVCYTSYEYCTSAVSTAGRAVRLIPVPKLPLPESVQDPETQAKIKSFASVLGKNAAESALHESLKLLPGGYVISKSFSEFYRSGNCKDQKIKELEAEILRLKMENEISSMKQAKLVNDMEKKKEHQNAPDMNITNHYVYQTPEGFHDETFHWQPFIG